MFIGYFLFGFEFGVCYSLEKLEMTFFIILSEEHDIGLAISIVVSPVMWFYFGSNIDAFDDGFIECKVFLANEVCLCLLYTSDAADDMQCVDLGGRRIIKKIGFFLSCCVVARAGRWCQLR